MIWRPTAKRRTQKMPETEKGHMETTKTAISIILPCRNADPALLARAVDSVLAQTYDDFELLIVDDGSDDKFREFLAAEEASDPRIRLLRQEPKGVSAARNLGIREARGAYITLLDADDTLSPWFLEEAAGAAAALDADFWIGGTCYIFRGQSVPAARGAEGLDPVKDAVQLTKDRLSSTRAECIGEPYRFDQNAYINRGIAARVVKREALTEKYLFPEGLRIAEDASWNLKMVSGLRGYYIPGIWYYYWENEQSVSNRYNPDVVSDMERHLRVIRRQMDLHSDREYRAFMDLMMDDLRYIYKCMIGNPQWKADRRQKKEVLDHLYRDRPWRMMRSARYRKLANGRDRFKAELYRLRLLFAFWSVKKGV